jgi:hypothetical protein
LYAYIIQVDIFIEGIQNIFKYIPGVKGYLNIIDLWFQQYLEKEMFGQMHVPDAKTTRTKTIYDKTGASLDWIILDSVLIFRVISFRFNWRSILSKHWFSEGEPYISQTVMYG